MTSNDADDDIDIGSLPELSTAGPNRGIAGLPGSKPAVLAAISDYYVPKPKPKSDRRLPSTTESLPEPDESLTDWLNAALIPVPSIPIPPIPMPSMQVQTIPVPPIVGPPHRPNLPDRKRPDNTDDESTDVKPILTKTGFFRPAIDQPVPIDKDCLSAQVRSAIDDLTYASSSSSSSSASSSSLSPVWQLQVFHTEEPLSWLSSVPKTASRIVVHHAGRSDRRPIDYGFVDDDRLIEWIPAGPGGAAGTVIRYAIDCISTDNQTGHVVFLSGPESAHGMAAASLDLLVRGDFAAPPADWLLATMTVDNPTLTDYYDYLIGRPFPPSGRLFGRRYGQPICFSVSHARLSMHTELFYRRCLSTVVESPAAGRLFGCLIVAIFGGPTANVDSDLHPFLRLT